MKKEAERVLKVGVFITPSSNTKPTRFKPSLLLQGNWLSDAGINPGDIVNLTISEKSILINKL
jgi:hypothetical protein